MPSPPVAPCWGGFLVYEEERHEDRIVGTGPVILIQFASSFDHRMKGRRRGEVGGCGERTQPIACGARVCNDGYAEDNIVEWGRFYRRVVDFHFVVGFFILNEGVGIANFAVELILIGDVT